MWGVCCVVLVLDLDLAGEKEEHACMHHPMSEFLACDPPCLTSTGGGLRKDFKVKANQNSANG